jgi:hypothetical protein
MLLPFYYVLRENGTLYGTMTVVHAHFSARATDTDRCNRTGVRKLPQCHPVFFFAPPAT